MARKRLSVAPITKTLFIFVSVCFISPGTSCRPDVTQGLLDIVWMMSGKYTNEQPLSGLPPGTIQAHLQPIDMPALFGDVEVYVKSSTITGLVLREEVFAFAENPGGFIEGKTYKVISDGKQPDELTENDLQAFPDECKMFFRQPQPDVFVSTRPKCPLTSENGLDLELFYPVNTVGYTCRGFTLFIVGPKPLKDETTRLPQPFTLVEERPPLPGFLTCLTRVYIPPCTILDDQILDLPGDLRDELIENDVFPFL